MHIFRRSIYDTRCPKHPHSPIRQYEWRPQEPCLVNPIICNHVRTWSVSTLCYVYIYGPGTTQKSKPSQSLCHRINICQLSVTSSVVGINSSALATVYELIWLNISNYIRLAVSDSIRLTVSDSIQFTVSDSIWLSVFWFSLNVFIFDLSYIIWVILQLDFSESHIVQGVLGIIQHWNRGIFHNYENLNFFGENTLNFSKIREEKYGEVILIPLIQWKSSDRIKNKKVDWVIETTGELCWPKGKRDLSGGIPWKIQLLYSGSGYVHT